MVKKNARILAIVLTLVMLFSSVALAAEGDHFDMDGQLVYSSNQVRADIDARNHVRIAQNDFQIEVGGVLYSLADANAAFRQDEVNWKEILKGEQPPAGDLEVVEVSAINANEIKVTFNKEVDVTTATDTKNYAITINNRRYVGTPAVGTDEITGKFILEDTPVLTDKGTAVVFKLADADSDTNRVKLDNGDKYGIDVRDGVKSVDGEKVIRYADTQKVFQDYDAPKLIDVKIVGGELELEFDEPVFDDSTASYPPNEEFKVTVDGKVVAMDTPSTDALDYTVTSTATLPTEALEKGIHNVVVYNARDLVLNNGAGGNKAPILRGTYEIADVEGEEPVVEAIVPIDFNSFYIIFDQAVENDFNVKVTHNGTEFYNQATDYEGYLDILPKDRTDYHYAVIELPYTAVSPSGGITLLYDKDHLSNSTNINVEIKDYKSASDSELLGKKYTSTLTLDRDNTEIEFLGTNRNTLNDTTGVLTAELNVLAREAKDFDNKIRVYDKNDIARTVLSASLAGNNLAVTIDDGTGNALIGEPLKKLAPFTVEVNAEALLLDTDDIKVPSTGLSSKEYIEPTGNGDDEADMWTELLDGSGYNKALIAYTNQLKNETLETTIGVEDPDENAYKAVEAVASVNVTNNVITITYKEEMGKGVTTLSNYTLDDEAMPAGTLIDIDGAGKEVTITLPKESIKDTGMKQVVISKDVQTKTGSYVVGNLSTKETYRSQLATFKDNVKPLLASAKFVLTDADDKTTSKIELTFNEKLDGQAYVANFVIIAHDGTEIALDSTATIPTLANENKLVIELEEAINITQATEVKVVSARDSGTDQVLADAEGNTLKENVVVDVKGTIVK